MTVVEDTSRPLGVDDVVNKLQDAIFGKRLITNVLRGQLVEAMVALVLEPEWTWCSADFASWDFERADGIRLEVKQTALLQTWTSSTNARSSPSFDIKARTGYWDEGTFINKPGRAAHLYILAVHTQIDDEADHRDPRQWAFFVLPSAELPAVGRIALGKVRQLTDSVSFDDLSTKVSQVARNL